MSPPFPDPINFGADIRDADGIRLHPGVRVRAEETIGEVVGWDGRSRVRIVDDDGLLLTVPAGDCRTISEVPLGSITRGWKVLTDESRPTTLIVPAHANMFGPSTSLSALPTPGHSQASWLKNCARSLSSFNNHEAARIVREELIAPDLEQVLNDSSLPEDIDHAYAVPVGGRGSVVAAELARLWLEGDSSRNISATSSGSLRQLKSHLRSDGLITVAAPQGRRDRALTSLLTRSNNAVRILSPSPTGVFEVDLP